MLRSLWSRHRISLASVASRTARGKRNSALQSKHLVLFHCAAKKPSHVLRAGPPQETQCGAQLHDELIANVFLHNSRATAVAPKRAGLAVRCSRQPTSIGGMGLSSALDTADAAWSSSYSTCWPHLQRISPVMADIDIATSALADHVAFRASISKLEAMEKRARVDEARVAASLGHQNHFGDRKEDFRPGRIPRAGDLPTVATTKDPEAKVLQHPQRRFMKIVNRVRWLDLKRDHGRTGNYRDGLRFMSVSQPNALAFLQVIPKCANMLIPSEMFDLIIQRQMGLPLSCSGGVRWSKSPEHAEGHQ